MELGDRESILRYQSWALIPDCAQEAPRPADIIDVCPLAAYNSGVRRE